MNCINKPYIKPYFALTFDDSPPQDKTVVEILDKYGIKGTFFVGVKHLIQPWTTKIYQNHEVGLHGIFHQDFSKLKYTKFDFHIFLPKSQYPSSLDFDIQISKFALEGAFKRDITSIAFPMHKGLEDKYLVHYIEKKYNLFVRPQYGNFKIYHTDKWGLKEFEEFEKNIIELNDKYTLVSLTELLKGIN